MTYAEIQKILREFMRNTPCTHCHTKYKARDIFVVAFVGMKGLFIIHCAPCRIESIVVATMRREKRKGKQGLRVETNLLTPDIGITLDEALDLKNKIRNFKGDLKELFS